MMWLRFWGAAALLVACGFGTASAQVKLDPKLKEYAPVEGVSGSLKSTGSDTMNNLMTLWAEGFRRIYPNVQIEIEGKGSSTAPVALIGGLANFGPMSRPMKAGEIADFEKKFGYPPTALPTSIDMLAVFVNRDNPIKGLTLSQVDAMFSSTRRRGAKDEIKTWGQVGLSGEWSSQSIALYGRNAASGTYGFFKEHSLANGDYKNSVKEQPGSSAVVQAVAKERFAVGYSGIGYKTADVRAVPLAAEDGDEFVAAEPENAYSGDYPLSRFLFVYVNHRPNSQLDPLRREFIRYVFSRQGQEVVIRDGYYPVTADVAVETLKSLGAE